MFKFKKKVILNVVAGNKLVAGKRVTLTETNEPGVVHFQAGIRRGEKYKVVSANWGEKSERSAGKAALGAITGGLLTGGVGAIAGAAIGGRKKDVSTAVLILEHEGQEYPLYVRCKPSEFEIITAMI